jgi:hypothetical protein
MQTVTRYVGKCPVCEGTFKLTQGLRMVHHGYERPGHGQIEGDCPGVGDPPFEASAEGSERYLACLLSEHARLVAFLSAIEGGQIQSLEFKEGHYRAQWEIVTPEAGPKWARAIQDARTRIGSQIRGYEIHIKRMQRLIASWVLLPLRTVEEISGEQAAGKAERAKARADARAAKLRAKIASYQKRLDSAIRRKSASAVAEIFEGACDKLAVLAGCSAAEALALLDRAHVWRAWGLEPTKSIYSNPTLREMRYGNPAWPADLGA